MHMREGGEWLGGIRGMFWRDVKVAKRERTIRGEDKEREDKVCCVGIMKI